MLEEVVSTSPMQKTEPAAQAGNGGEPSGQALRSWLDQPVARVLILNWETIAWILLLLVAIVSRYYDLGARAMSHDESLHAHFSYVLYNEGRFEHTPMMHGSFLFHVNAFIYFLFGATDATTRFGPALAGVGVIWMAWAFRRYIGRLGALLAGVFLTISPSLLFHSRYIRNDIYIAFFSMLWIYGMFRYMEDRRKRWLYLMVTGMALSFITKENAFMNGALFGAFAAGIAAWRAFTYQEKLRFNPALDVAVTMLTLVLPFTAPFAFRLFGWEQIDWTSVANITTQDIVRWTVLVLAVTAASIGLAYYWFAMRSKEEAAQRSALTFGGWGGLMVFFWVVQVTFFTTFFTNPVNGLATGIVGSLGYWLAQQAVQRGSQPWYYYILIGGLYEFLPIVLSLAGLVVVLRWLWNPRWDPVPASQLIAGEEETGAALGESANGRQGRKAVSKAKGDYEQPVTSRQRRIYFVVFLCWWTVSAWTAYTVAGEKMPWLLTHMAQPMAIFGGWWLGSMLGHIEWGKVRQHRAYWLALLLPGLIFALYLLIDNRPFQGRDLFSLAETMRWIFALAAGGGLFYFLWNWAQQVGWSDAGRLLASGGVLVLTLMTIRTAYMLTYVNYDYVNEYLVYAHASPDIKRALREIEVISERTVGDKDIQVAYDNDTSWPLTWYMREYPNSIFYGDNPSIGNAMSAPVILVGSANYGKVEPYVARDYVSRTYRLIWWPEERYKDLTWDRIKGALTDPEWRSRLWQIFFYRRHPDLSLTEWPNRHEFRMYVKRDLARIVWDLNVTPTTTQAESAAPITYEEVDLSAIAVYGGLFGDQPLLQPRAIAVGQDGARIIADSGNSRIVVLDAAGNFLRAFGSLCTLSNGEAGGCVDPDGAGPLQLGDGQFWEPWGVAVDQDGNIYVADTWNGRIQVFDPDGRFLRKWGVFAAADPTAGDPFAMFGPRGMAFDLDGNLLVADTGNKRILRFTPDGQFLNQIGGGGFILGRFEEPTDIAVDPRTGVIFVADSWNRRIQKLSHDFVPLEEWPVPGWESRDIFDKPYLAVDGNGTVYATDPQFFLVYVYSAGGTLQVSFGRYGTDLSHFGKPNGLAVDPTTNDVLVADADNNRIMVFPPVTE